MPFTFSHIAIILPLQRWPRWFDLTALAIGSMSPDFAYFLMLNPNAMFGHDVVGLLLFDLPITIVAAVIFHRLLKAPLIAHLPAPYDGRLAPLGQAASLPQNFRGWRIFSYSALIGAASHILWDAFTHEGEFFVELWPALSTPVLLSRFRLPLYDLLQYGCSLGGLVIVIYALWRLSRHNLGPPPAQRLSRLRKCYYWALVGSCSLILGLVKLGLVIYLPQPAKPGLPEIPLLVEFIVGAIAGGLLGLLVGALVAGRSPD